LQTISLPNCTRIGTYAFWNCSRLSSLYLLAIMSSINFHSSFLCSASVDLNTFKIYVRSAMYQKMRNFFISQTDLRKFISCLTSYYE
jgi:hypothetical protein